MIDRRAAVAGILGGRDSMLVVTGLGSPTYDVFAAGDDDLNFYLWGAMGSAAMVGLGLALAQPERSVVVFTGDGEMLMGLGAFATIAQHRPANLSIIVLDNEQYAETGLQTTATGHGADLAAIARASGLSGAVTLRSWEDVRALRARIDRREETIVAVLKIEPGEQPRTAPLRDGAAIAHRFRASLLGQ
jgi:thiamine pyrophosphate-dependent acetolactate synthase large subunit-like protein